MTAEVGFCEAREEVCPARAACEKTLIRCRNNGTNPHEADLFELLLNRICNEPCIVEDGLSSLEFADLRPMVEQRKDFRRLELDIPGVRKR